MIQRVQTLYLAIILFLAILCFRGSVFNCIDETGQVIKVMLSGNLTDKSGQSFAKVSPLWPVTALLVLITVTSLATIALYSKRKVQMKIAAVLIVFTAGFIIALASYAYTVTNSYKLTIVPVVGTTYPALMLLFSLLAYRGIAKDDKLVRSYDRLR
jgi:hypothetical protein